MIHKYSFLIVLISFICLIQSALIRSSPFHTENDVKSLTENTSMDFDQLESEMFQLESCIEHIQSSKLNELDSDQLETCKHLFDKAASERIDMSLAKRSSAPRSRLIRRFFSLNVGKSSPIHQLNVESQKGFKYGK